MNTQIDKLLLELEGLGFPILADWIHNGEISNLNGALKHLDENKYMMDDKEDKVAFKRAEEIVKIILKNPI